MWSSCSNTCGKGMKRRHRTCSSPKPNQLGDACDGDSSEYELCNQSDCPGNAWYGVFSRRTKCTIFQDFLQKVCIFRLLSIYVI